MKFKHLTFFVLAVAVFSGKSLIASSKGSKPSFFIKSFLLPAENLLESMKTKLKNKNEYFKSDENKITSLLNKSNDWLEKNKNELNEKEYKNLENKLDQLTKNYVSFEDSTSNDRTPITKFIETNKEKIENERLQNDHVIKMNSKILKKYKNICHLDSAKNLAKNTYKLIEKNKQLSDNIKKYKNDLFSFSEDEESDYEEFYSLMKDCKPLSKEKHDSLIEGI